MMDETKPLIKHISSIEEIVAGDNCFLREIFHPQRDEVKIKYSLAHAYIQPGGKTIDHYLLESETYYIISGKGIMHIGNEKVDVEAGNSFYVPAKCHQWLENVSNEKIEFLVIVDPPWMKENEFVFE